MLLIHIIAGALALAAGWIALFSPKGARLHRASGMVFVCTMLVMSATGAVMAALLPSRISVIGGVLAFYLVTTALLAVRRPADRNLRWLDVSAMLVALAVSGAAFALALAAMRSPTGRVDGLPPGPAIMFGVVAGVASLLDLRMLARGIQGAHRIARHLWRMCFALWIATMSFFLGQPDVFPEPLRQLVAVRAIPVLIVAVTMIYWLVRVLRGRRRGGFVATRTEPRAPAHAKAAGRAAVKEAI
jgi:hypothetical protein